MINLLNNLSAKSGTNFQENMKFTIYVDTQFPKTARVRIDASGECNCLHPNLEKNASVSVSVIDGHTEGGPQGHV